MTTEHTSIAIRQARENSPILESTSHHKDTFMLVAEAERKISKSIHALDHIAEEGQPTLAEGQILLSENQEREIQQILKEQELATISVMEDAKTKLHKQLSNPENLSPAYSSNSGKEEMILKYIQNFQRQYHQLYPSRKPLPMALPNECDTIKFVCSTIRPTQLPFKQLYDYKSCASFVADFIAFEALNPEHETPKILRSPTFTLATQSGNCFEMSTVLASLLIGVGYNAYVVSGYASKRITTLDRSQTLAKLDDYVDFKANDNVEAVKLVKAESKYKVKAPVQLVSAFEIRQKQLTKEQMEKEEIKRQEAEANQQRDFEEHLDDDDNDDLKGIRVHSWVLVLPGKRNITTPFFIEPTTGEIVPTTSKAYLGLESVWSHRNYWVNMQACTNGVQSISFDLDDTNKWEFLLVQPAVTQDQVVDAPSSWVDKLDISDENFLSRCPTGGKVKQYRNCQATIFAEYNRKDGMIQRLVFNENEKIHKGLTVESFVNRKDKLHQRLYRNDEIKEYFHGGRLFCLKEHVMIKGVTKRMDFYSVARADGLNTRIETDRKTVLLFEDRDDRLYYRSIAYELIIKEGAEPVRGQMLKMTEKFHRNPEIPADEDFAKISYFLKEDRIAVTFHFGPDKIVQSTREFRKTPQEQKKQVLDMISNYVVDPLAPKMYQQDLYLQYLRLVESEQNLLQEVKKYNQELSDILNLRKNEENDLILSISIYDTVRNASTTDGSKEGKHDTKISRETQLDYLSPYLIQFENPAELTKDQAMQVKEAALKTLKDRLVEKATIIQSRLDQVTSDLQKRQTEFAKTEISASEEEKDEYTRFCAAAVFKINILEKRLSKHKQVAPEKLTSLGGKLRADPRLIAAFI